LVVKYEEVLFEMGLVHGRFFCWWEFSVFLN